MVSYLRSERYLRFTVAIGCFIMLMLEAYSLYKLVSASNTIYLGDLSFECETHQYVLTIVLFSVAMVGLIGVINDHMTTMKAFLFLLLCGLIFNLIVLMFLENSTEQEAEIELLSKSLYNCLSSYDWRHNRTSAEIVDSTKFWDSIQAKGHCCGVYDRRDWDLVRPINATAYPGSCCSPPFPNRPDLPRGLCAPDEVFEDGCKHYIRETLASDSTRSWLWTIIYFVIFIVGAAHLYQSGNFNF